MVTKAKTTSLAVYRERRSRTSPARPVRRREAIRTQGLPCACLAPGTDEQHPDAQAGFTLSAITAANANLSKDCV